MAAQEDIYCTLVLNDAYLPGAAVLAHSLRDSGTTKKLGCMIAQENLSAANVEELQSLYNYVIPIERIGNPSPANLYLMNRPDLLYTFSKIHLWRLTQFRKIVYIDADVVALRAPEELFALPDDFAAAPDVGWPDIFNTGVMVLTPNEGHFAALRTLAAAGDSFDGADQGLLNQYFEYRPWKRLSFTYNTTPSANYQYEPAYRYYKRDISMVHFIGSEKPWQRSRSSGGAPSAFQESLGRWWAVWDRHYQVSTHDYVQGHRHPPQQHSYHGRQLQQPSNSSGDNYYATGYPTATTQPAPPPPSSTAQPDHTPAPPPEIPMTEPGEPAEQIAQGHIQPTPTVEQRRFSAPQMEWDATRGAPPVESKPEASNFPTTTYEFNSDPAPFRPPQSYPDPPKDMWYEVPREKPRPQEKPRPIFPWEERPATQPTRRFIEDEQQQPPQPEPEPELEDFGLADELEVTADKAEGEEAPSTTPAVEVAPKPVQNIWEAFASNRLNAWDDVSGIDSYVRRLQNRGKSPTPTQRNSAAARKSASSSAEGEEPDVDDLVGQVERRRESLILTEFPSATERPSLPVTPAPRRRGLLWGDERDEAVAELPEAEGVPDQAEWDPASQLEQLRRNSLLATDLKLPPHKALPNRVMPRTAAPIPEEVLGHPVASPSAPPAPPASHGILKQQQSRTPSPPAVTVVPSSGGSSPHGLVPSPPPPPAQTRAELTELNTAMNAATAAAPSVGDALFSTPNFKANPRSPGPPVVDEVDQAASALDEDAAKSARIDTPTAEEPLSPTTGMRTEVIEVDRSLSPQSGVAAAVIDARVH